MKKLASLFICILLICGIVSVPASAATNYCKLFNESIGTMRWALVMGQGESASIAEGQAFTADTIFAFCRMELAAKYADYDKEFFYIPAAELDALAKNSFAVFNVNDLRSAKYEHWDQSGQIMRNYYVADKNAYEFPSAGGMGDSTVYTVQGYVQNGSKYTVYSHYIDQAGDEVPAGKVEGKDYIVYNGIKCMILHSLKNVVETDGKNVKFHSWQRVTSIPSSGLITPTTKVEDPKPTEIKPTVSKPTASKPTASTPASSTESTVSEPEKTTVTIAETETAKLETKKDVFPEYTIVTVKEIKEDVSIKKIETALKDISTKFVAYEITAECKNVSVQPNGMVKATFDIPDGYNLDLVTVYYVATDGTTQMLYSNVDKESRTVSAELSHFSTYVVAEKTTTEALPAESDTADKTENSNKSSTVIWIIIAVAAILIIGGGVACFLIFKKK